MNENQKKVRKTAKIILLIYVAFVMIMGVIGQKQLRYTEVQDVDLGTGTSANIGIIQNDVPITQSLTIDGDYVEDLTLKFATFGNENKNGNINVQLESNDGTVLLNDDLEVADIKDSQSVILTVNQSIKDIDTSNCTLTITATGLGAEDTVTSFTQLTDDAIGQGLHLGDNPLSNNVLVATVGIRHDSSVIYYYYPVMFVIFLGLLFYFYKLDQCAKLNKPAKGLDLIVLSHKYQFLLDQLIKRDFKTKYKRSVLGIFWSVLNPLLTMCVQYAVFSQIFKFDVPNYSVYLLTGTVIFNSCTDSINQGIYSIINNASLITKVYVPKLIYPISKVLSTSINLLFSFIPLLVLAWITGLRPNLAYLLIPYCIICLILFSLGFAFMLSALMVFLRDIQFLWSIFTLVWMYATPILYPIDILPGWMAQLMNLNPMYYFVSFIRTILIDGVAPSPQMFVIIAFIAALSLFIGTKVFQKLQNKFALYI